MTVFNRAIPYVLTMLAAGVPALYAYEPVEAGRAVNEEPAADEAAVVAPHEPDCPRTVWPYVASRCLDAVGRAELKENVRVVYPDRFDRRHLRVGTAPGI